MARVLTNIRLIDGQTEIKNAFLRFEKRIIDSGMMADFELQPDDQQIDCLGKIVVPGFIDMHCHGGYGMDTMTGNPDDLVQLVKKLAQEGVTGVLLTTMTQSVPNIQSALKSIVKATETSEGILGIHLEGPFVAKAYHGAQPASEIINFNPNLFDSWQQIAKGRIKAVTYAPELPNSDILETQCHENGILASIGHSQATFTEADKAHADRVTHLYNAQTPLHHRDVGVVGEAFLNPNLNVELIVDGIHVSPEAVKIAYQQIGSDRLELVTDSMEARGMPDGVYELGGQQVNVANGAAKLINGHLAGSVLKFKDAFKNMIQFTGCSLLDAVKMSSVNQARELGLTDQGNLVVGSVANINVFDNDLDLWQTYYQGEPLNRR